MGKETMEKWPVAKDSPGKRFKLFMSGPPGCFKTRVMMHLANNGIKEEPALAVVDTEFGTDQYRGEFAFRFLQESDPAVIKAKTADLVKAPGEVKTLGFDSFSVYYEALVSEWADRFLKRELSSAGHKQEYYTVQPRDYQHINRSASKVVRRILASSLNLICICQIKDDWQMTSQGLKVVGTVFDGYKRLPYYFDTIIEIGENPAGGWKAVVKGKDRSGSLKPNQEIPWVDSDSIAKYLIDKFGQDFTTNASDPGNGGKLKKTTTKASTKSATKTKSASKKPAEEEGKVDTSKKDSKGAEKATETKIVEKAKSGPSETTAATKPEKETKTNEMPAKDTSLTNEVPEKDTSGPVAHNKLVEIVQMKGEAKINDPQVWKEMVAKYNKINEDGSDSGVPLETAKEMTMFQADELLRDIVRHGENPT